MMEDLDGGILSIGEMKSDGASGSAQLIIAVMRAWTTCPKKKCPTGKLTLCVHYVPRV